MFYYIVLLLNEFLLFCGLQKFCEPNNNLRLDRFGVEVGFRFKTVEPGRSSDFRRQDYLGQINRREGITTQFTARSNASCDTYVRPCPFHQVSVDTIQMERVGMRAQNGLALFEIFVG